MATAPGTVLLEREHHRALDLGNGTVALEARSDGEWRCIAYTDREHERLWRGWVELR